MLPKMFSTVVRAAVSAVEIAVRMPATALLTAVRAAVNFCLAAEKNSAMEDWALLRNAAADATAFCAAAMT